MVCCWCLYMSVTISDGGSGAGSRFFAVLILSSSVRERLSGALHLPTGRMAAVSWPRTCCAHASLHISADKGVQPSAAAYGNLLKLRQESELMNQSLCCLLTLVSQHMKYHVCALSFVCANGYLLKRCMGCFTSNMSVMPGVLHPSELPFISMVVAQLMQYMTCLLPSLLMGHVYEPWSTALLNGRHGSGTIHLWICIATNNFRKLDAVCPVPVVMKRVLCSNLFNSAYMKLLKYQCREEKPQEENALCEYWWPFMMILSAFTQRVLKPLY